MISSEHKGILMKSLIMSTLVLLTFELSARELGPQEKLALIPLKKTLEVKTFMEENINVQELSVKDYFIFQVIKKSCAPMSFLLDSIKNQDESYPDQSKKIVAAYQFCSEGVLGLSHLYTKQN